MCRADVNATFRHAPSPRLAFANRSPTTEYPISRLTNGPGVLFFRLQQQATASTTVGDRSIMSIVDSSHQHLDCITKQRAKGPSGRRLPRQAKSRLVYPDVQQQQQQRSESLSKLEQQQQQPMSSGVCRSSQVAVLPVSNSRLLHRMMQEFDSSPSPSPSTSRQLVADFDQSWFMADVKRVASSSSSGPEVVVSGGNTPPPRSAAAATNRYCHLL